MEVAYFKILDPLDKKEAIELVDGFIEILGGIESWDNIVTAESDENTSRLFVFSDLSKIEKAKQFLIEENYLLEFELKTKDYIIMKDLDPSMNEDDNPLILSKFLKENMTVDDVLDKIIYSGMTSLNKIDLKILENKKP